MGLPESEHAVALLEEKHGRLIRRGARFSIIDWAVRCNDVIFAQCAVLAWLRESFSACLVCDAPLSGSLIGFLASATSFSESEPVVPSNGSASRFD